MDVMTAIEKCLKDLSPIRAKDLHVKLRERRINISRSQFYRYGKKLEKDEKLERKNGIWYYQKKLSHENTAEEELKRMVRSKIDEARQAWENGDLAIANRKIWTASELLTRKSPKLALTFFFAQCFLQNEEEQVLRRFPNVTRSQKREIVSFVMHFMIDALEGILERKGEEISVSSKGGTWSMEWTAEQLHIEHFSQLMGTLLRSIGLLAESNKEAESHESWHLRPRTL